MVVKPEKKSTLSSQLIGAIFRPYLLMAIIITCFQMYFEFKSNKQDISREIEEIEQVFKDNLSLAYWTIDELGVNSILQGIVAQSIVTGIKVYSLKDELEYSLEETSKDSQSNILTQWAALSTALRFPLELETIKNKGVETVGWGVIYTNNNVVIDRIKDGFYLIIINSLIKTAILWFIVRLFIEKMVAKPMQGLRQKIHNLNFSSLQQVELNSSDPDELQEINHTLNTLIQKVQGHHNEMELTVTKRTAELKAANEELKNISLKDPLTNAYNRRKFIEDSRIAFYKFKRDKQPVSLVSIDIDFFKKINDTFGHKIGDMVLVELVEIIHSSLRLSDSIYRFGGEEFVVLLHNTELKAAILLTERIRAKIASVKLNTEQHQVGVTISAGIAMVGEDDDTDLSKCLKLSDTALYQAKQTGRNKIVVANS